MKIKSLNTSLFKGFKNTKVNFDSGLNLLVGGNNSGKSSILQAVHLAFHFLQLTGGINEFDTKRGGKDRLRGVTVKSIPLPFHEEAYLSEGLKKRSLREKSTSMVIEVDGGLQFKETITFPGGNLLVISSDVDNGVGKAKYRKKIKEIIRKDSFSPLFIPTFAGVANREEIKMAQVVKYYIASGKSSEVLRNQLIAISKHKKQFQKLNSYLKKGFEVEIVSNDTKEIYLSSLYKENEYDNLDISSAGSGFQQVLQILLYIVTSNAKIILIDEPDAHLHYRLQNVLYDILLEIVADGRQIILATHSQVFIQRAVQHNDRLILVNKVLDQQKPINEYSEGLRSLYQAGVIDEIEVTRGASLKLIDLEDAQEGPGFQIMKEFLFALNFREPEYRIISSGENIFGYVSGREKIDKIKLKSLVLRDGDSLSGVCLEKIEEKNKKNGFSLIFSRVHEVENYLINADIIQRLLKSKGVNRIGVAGVKKIIEEIVNKEKDNLIDHLESALKSKYKKYYRELDLDYGTLDDEEKKRRLEIKNSYFSYPYSYFPGKEIFKLLKQDIHHKFQISISEIEVAKVFKPNEIPKEVKDSLKFFDEKVLSS